MVSIEKAISNDLIGSLLPKYGDQPGAQLQIPAWDNSQKMFICDEYESKSGHRYYRGIRFCDRIVIVEKVGLYHNWTYIDGIELYAFNGEKPKLIQKRDYDKVFRNEEFIRTESETMVKDYISGMAKAQGVSILAKEVENNAKELIDGCYKSFLDSDFNTRLTQIIPAIEQKQD